MINSAAHTQPKSRVQRAVTADAFNFSSGQLL